MEEKIVKEDLERLLKEIKVRIESKEETPNFIERYPIPTMLAAFGAGVILSQVEGHLFECEEDNRNCSAIQGLLKLGLPLILKKIIK